MSLRAWPTGIMPSALVNEKLVSAFELRIATPSPSSFSGGRISGNRSSQKRARRFDSRSPPWSAKAAIASRCGASAAASVRPGSPGAGAYGVQAISAEGRHR